jgi:hypothetical protein
VREQAILQTDQEHQRKLQSLGRVQRHQLHRILVGIRLGIPGFERGGEKTVSTP